MLQGERATATGLSDGAYEKTGLNKNTVQEYHTIVSLG